MSLRPFREVGAPVRGTDRLTQLLALAPHQQTATFWLDVIKCANELKSEELGKKETCSMEADKIIALAINMVANQPKPSPGATRRMRKRPRVSPLPCHANCETFVEPGASHRCSLKFQLRGLP